MLFAVTQKAATGGPPVVELLRDGRYAVYAELGAGAQGETLSAVDRREGRPVAVKRFRIRGARSWKDVELAEREARVLARLAHPALPRYVEHFEADGCLYLVMERVEGEPLAALRARGERFDEATVVRYLHDASAVLDYLHSQSPPVIHRDLKPGNVLRRADGSFAFVDFGAVRDSLRPEGGSTVVGTFGYMAPEQFQGRATPATDVYSVGATALALLTGCEPEQLPHRGLSLDVHAALGPRANPRLVRLLERLLEPDPDRRPSALAPLLGELRPPPTPTAHARAGGPGARAASADAGGPRRERRHARWSDANQPHGPRRRQRRRRAQRDADPEEFPLALGLLGLGLLRWLLAIVFGRLVPQVLDASGALTGPDAARTRARVAAVERSLGAKLARLEARLSGEPPPTEEAAPSSPAPRYRAPTPSEPRARVATLDVEGEEIGETPPTTIRSEDRRR